jgi:hypothetical protein
VSELERSRFWALWWGELYVRLVDELVDECDIAKRTRRYNAHRHEKAARARYLEVA